MSLPTSRQYTRNLLLLEADLPADPITLFRRWLDDAAAAEVYEPTAMMLATVDADGQPSARVVLLKALDEGLDGGFCFYTHYDSRKGQALAVNPRAGLSFWWDRLERCVRIEGEVEKLPRERAVAYFHSRPRGSQLATLTSRQSQAVTGREALDTRLAENTARYAEQDIPCPQDWGGYRLRPRRIEFWQGRDSRFHDRLVYHRAAEGWRIERLEP